MRHQIGNSNPADNMNETSASPGAVQIEVSEQTTDADVENGAAPKKTVIEARSLDVAVMS